MTILTNSAPEKGSSYQLNTNDYLDKARAMFEEMDLQWDLDELDKIVASV